ncbi:MAG: CsbD family protein [Alphaproteobacteria bacterium]|nr:MAG: CsbD family protein [Alphaproteobacteria bacterium]
MDSNRVDGAATNLGGKLKDAVGGLIGDTGMQAEGKRDQVGGRMQNAYGSAKDSASDGAATLANQIEDFVHDQPVVAMLSAATIGFLIARLIR